MSNGNSIVNFGDLSKPVDTLIHKISDAIGVLYEPKKIINIAKAESKAMEIKAITELRIQELQKRALTRFIHEETKKQENIEKIIEKAIPSISENAETEKVEQDWLFSFFDKSKLISDNEMQKLWSNILAGESNSPGKYSKKTLEILSCLDKKDAILFTKLCSFGFQLGNIVIVIFDVMENIYNDYGINFNSLTHLENIGLLNYDNLTGFVRTKLPQKIQMYYYGKSFFIEFPNEKNNTLNIGKILLSNSGQELAEICGSKKNDSIFEYTTNKWREMNLVVNI